MSSVFFRFLATNSISASQNEYFSFQKTSLSLSSPCICSSHGYLKQAHRRKEGCMAQFPYGPVEWPRSIQLVRRSRPDVPAIRKRAPHWGSDAWGVSVRNPLNSWSMTLLSSCRKATQPVSLRHRALHLHPLPALPPLPTDPLDRENTFRVSGSTSTGHTDPTVPEMTGSMRSEWVERSREKRSEAEWKRGEWQTVAVM